MHSSHAHICRTHLMHTHAMPHPAQIPRVSRPHLTHVPSTSKVISDASHIILAQPSTHHTHPMPTPHAISCHLLQMPSFKPCQRRSFLWLLSPVLSSRPHAHIPAHRCAHSDSRAAGSREWRAARAQLTAAQWGHFGLGGSRTEGSCKEDPGAEGAGMGSTTR